VGVSSNRVQDVDHPEHQSIGTTVYSMKEIWTLSEIDHKIEKIAFFSRIFLIETGNFWFRC